MANETAAKIIFFGILAIIIAPLIFWGFIKLAGVVSNTPWGAIGQTATSTPIAMPGALAKIINAVIGPFDAGSITLEGLILRLAIFVIIFFAISEIILLGFIFSDATSYMIGFGLALIAGVTKVVYLSSTIFGAIAGLGALGIALIILGTLASAVTLSLGIGGPVRRWRMMRHAEVESMKAASGTAGVVSAVGGLKQVAKALREGEKI